MLEWYRERRREILPQVRGIRTETVDAMKPTEPNQSNLLILSATFPGSRSSFRNRKMATAPVPIIGTLIQKIHLQETFCAKAPPIKGPPTEPIAHMLPRYPNHAKESYQHIPFRWEAYSLTSSN
jgi:hypothetical protein